MYDMEMIKHCFLASACGHISQMMLNRPSAAKLLFLNKCLPDVTTASFQFRPVEIGVLGSRWYCQASAYKNVAEGVQGRLFGDWHARVFAIPANE
jgi:hypothetical protein